MAARISRLIVVFRRRQRALPFPLTNRCRAPLARAIAARIRARAASTAKKVGRALEENAVALNRGSSASLTESDESRSERVCAFNGARASKLQSHRAKNAHCRPFLRSKAHDSVEQTVRALCRTHRECQEISLRYLSMGDSGRLVPHSRTQDERK